MRFKGEPVLLVAEVESFDGVSVQGRCVTTTAVVLGRTFTHVDRTDEYVHYRPPDYRNHQPASIPVLHRHDRDRRVGRVEYLKWVDGRILAVAEVEGDEAAHWMALGNCYISPGVRCSTRNGRNVDIKLDHLGLVERTTRVGARAVEWSVTSFEERHHWTPQTTPGYRLLVEAEARRKRRAGAPLEIVDHPDVPVAVECGPLFRDTGRPIRTTSSSFDEKVGAAVRAGADPWGAMWRAGGQSGAMVWDGPNGVTYGIHSRQFPPYRVQRSENGVSGRKGPGRDSTTRRSVRCRSDLSSQACLRRLGGMGAGCG